MSRQRAGIIEVSVRVEEMVTNQVCLMLGIDKKTSKVFGTTSSSISFNTKIELLKELDYFDATDRAKFTRFAEIRNKFAHLSHITTHKECVDSISGLLKNFQKWYPHIKTNSYELEEELYTTYILELVKDISTHVEKFTKYFNDKVHIKSELDVKKKYHDILLETIDVVIKDYVECQEVNEFIGKVLKQAGETYGNLYREDDRQGKAIKGPIL